MLERQNELSFLKQQLSALEIENEHHLKHITSFEYSEIPEEIRKINKKYRKIDKATDVLSFPMFEKEELEQKIASKDFLYEDMLGDLIISIEKVKEQAIEYGHSFERELSYMLVHGFYHLMGYDHIEEEDKKKMRPKEEKILNELKITRD